LGWDERIGSIEVGKDADLTTIALDEFDTLPVYNPISQIVYASNRRDVRDVWVRGERKLDGGRLTGFDTEQLAATARSWGARMRRKD